MRWKNVFNKTYQKIERNKLSLQLPRLFTTGFIEER